MRHHPDELERRFEQGIARLATEGGMSREQALAALAKRYDGYRFAPNAENVYNPFSLLAAIRDGIMGDYWFESGTPKFLAAILKRHRIAPKQITDDPIAPSSLNALDSLSESPLPLLYQSGYLALAGPPTRTGSFYLRFPNEEVKHGFWQQLLPLYAAQNKTRTNALLDRLVAALEQDKPENLIRELQALFADIPYELNFLKCSLISVHPPDCIVITERLHTPHRHDEFLLKYHHFLEVKANIRKVHYLTEAWCAKSRF